MPLPTTMPLDLPIARIRLLRSNIGAHYSLLVTLQGGDLMEADLRSADIPRLSKKFDLVEAPADEQHFATARVIILQEKGKEVKP